MKKLVLFAMTLVLFSYAEARRDKNREGRQDARIAHGVKSGELTKHESRKLIKGQKKVDRFQRKAMKDGEMDAQEKLKLERMQDRQSKMIYKQKHDQQDRDRGNNPSEPPVVQPAPVDGSAPTE